MMERWSNMIQFSISLLVANIMLISPVLTLGDHLQLDPVEESSVTSLNSDHKIKIVKTASFLKFLFIKSIGALCCKEDHTNFTMINDHLFKKYSDFLPYDKPFFVVKKFQSNYIS
jgi:hypothetical protein